MLHTRHKDFVRFISFKDFDKLSVNNIEIAEYQIYCLCRVLFGVSSSPLSLTGTLVHHMTTFSSINQDFMHNVLNHNMLIIYAVEMHQFNRLIITSI